MYFLLGSMLLAGRRLLASKYIPRYWKVVRNSIRIEYSHEIFMKNQKTRYNLFQRDILHLTTENTRQSIMISLTITWFLRKIGRAKWRMISIKISPLFHRKFSEIPKIFKHLFWSITKSFFDIPISIFLISWILYFKRITTKSSRKNISEYSEEKIMSFLHFHFPLKRWVSMGNLTLSVSPGMKSKNLLY